MMERRLPLLSFRRCVAGVGRQVACRLLLLFALAGCSPADRSADPAPIAAAESDWSAQVAAVQSGESDSIAVAKRTVTGDDLKELSQGCERLRNLEIDACSADDAELEPIGRLTQLRTLKLGADVGDAGLTHLGSADGLTTLNLPRASFSDQGLEVIAALPRLQLLRFHSPHVTDAGLAHIAEMKSLRFLHLIDVPITDAGLPQLYGMTQLESFYLDGGGCSDEALRELLRALPQLHFHRDQLHLPDDPRAHPHD